MTSNGKQGNPLATMLIISAIDVLLCAFTATVTLFFLGGGTMPGKDDQENGWDGALVVIRGKGQETLRFSSDVPAEVIRPGSVFLLQSTPSRDHPARFRLDGTAPGPFDIDVTVVREGTTGEGTRNAIHCPGVATYVFRVTDADVPISAEADCVARVSLTGSPVPR
jgi:hypothetical protein